MSDYLEEFRERLRQLDEDHAARMAKIDRDGRLMYWLGGGLVAMLVIAEIVIAVVRS